MCGIAATFNYRSPTAVSRGEMRRMLERMKPRGPDGSGEWYSPDLRVGLGHRRLAIIDLSESGAQPMQSADGKRVISFNGEIYNYQALRSELQAKGCQFRSQSDTEVLLHLYQLEGEAMLLKLRGMYAFAIWDEDRRALFLARDPFGIKPLYYANDGSTLRVASQVKALLASGAIDRAPEPAGHVGFFLWGHVPDPYTLHKQIRAVPAGCFLWVDENGAGKTREFCSIPRLLAEAGQRAKDNGNTGPRDYRTTGLQDHRLVLRDALLDSVRHHLIADVPAGVFLSAGLDSTTVASLATEGRGRLRTVTLGFEEYRGTSNEETSLAEAVARQLKTDHHTVWVKRADFETHRDALFDAMDQPSTDGVNTYFVSLAAKRTSLKVALSGLGGDELFGGYPSFTEIPRAVRALGFLPAGNALGRMFRAVSAPVLKHFTSPKYAGLLEYGGCYSGAYLLRRGMFMPWELPGILDADFVREGWTELQPLARLDEALDGLCGPRAKVSAMEMNGYMRNQLLRDADWAGMAHSIEIRVPLVDLALLRSLAPQLVSEVPPTKRDMAASPVSPLPSSVLNRPKTGFSVPVREWLAAQSLEVRNPRSAGERGLRRWAREVYARFSRDNRTEPPPSRGAEGLPHRPTTALTQSPVDSPVT